MTAVLQYGFDSGVPHPPNVLEISRKQAYEGAYMEPKGNKHPITRKLVRSVSKRRPSKVLI